MKKHGWQLPYHPLQVVAVAVFVALGFAFYVFFAPFVGNKMFQYIVMGLYTPLVICVVGLYIWCAAADPADLGVFKSKKYLNIPFNKKQAYLKESKLDGDSTFSGHTSSVLNIDEPDEEVIKNMKSKKEKKGLAQKTSYLVALLASLPFAIICSNSNSQDESLEQQMSEEDMFYCNLCEVEVLKYSKHCRVCDKCVDHFDHHCRWLNNCIGKRNYQKFFILMVCALLLLILQWSTGIVVLIGCFIDHKRSSAVIASNLGSSFSLVPFVIVVAVCSILGMIASLPLAQLFFFHILLIKKGISTYDYIIALREQEQQGTNGQRSPQMSPASSFTGLSSASSFNTFHRGAWCTPPRLFLEDQFDVVAPDSGSVSSLGKRPIMQAPVKTKNPTAVKISPWTLARLNPEQVSKVAAEARKKSKVLQPVARREASNLNAVDSVFGDSGRRMVPRPDSKRASKRIRLPMQLPLDPLPKIFNGDTRNTETTMTSTSLDPLQFEAQSAFQTGQTMSSSARILVSSPDSSLTSPDIRLYPFFVSSSKVEEARRLTELSDSSLAAQPEISLSRCNSDGYEASGGEDSDRVPSRTVESLTNWNNFLFNPDQDDSDRVGGLRMASSSSGYHNRKV